MLHALKARIIATFSTVPGKGHNYLENVLDGPDQTHVVLHHLRELVEVCRRLQCDFGLV